MSHGSEVNRRLSVPPKQIRCFSVEGKCEGKEVPVLN